MEFQVINQGGSVPGERRRSSRRRREDAELDQRADLGQLYRNIMDAVTEGIIALSADGTVLNWNRGAERIFGYAESEVSGRHVSFLSSMLLPELHAAEGCYVPRWEGVLEHKDGTPVAVSIDSSRMPGSAQVTGGFVWVIRDIGMQQRAVRILQQREARLHEEAHTDPLTGVANRRRLDQVMHAEVSRADRHGGRLSLVLIDLDNLKSINDEHGHAAGDAALRTFCSVIQAQLRTCDFLARFGGDEFLVLMPDTSCGEAQACVGRMRAALDQARVMDLPILLTASFGIAEHNPGDAAELSLFHADKALYLAKHNGRNCAQHWNAAGQTP